MACVDGMTDLPGVGQTSTTVRMRRVESSVYRLGGLVAVLGTIGLITSVLLDRGLARWGLAAAVVAWVAAWTVLVVRDRQGARLLQTTEQANAVLRSLGEARRAVLRNADPRQALVDGALGVTGASLVLLSEVKDAELVASASAGPPIQHFALPLDRPSISRRVLESGEPIQVADIHDEPALRSALTQIESMLDFTVRSVAWVPIILDSQPVGVITAAFAAADVGLADQAVPILTMLAQEAAVAIDRERLVANLNRMTLQDPLTGLANRRAWDLALDRLDRDGAVTLIDLDHFKTFNDTYGHPAGDRLLRAFGATMVSLSRSNDTVARIGGEEFAIATADRESMRSLVERIRAAWREMPDVPTFSAGVAARQPFESAVDLLARCDLALYAAKGQGRDRIVQAAPAWPPMDALSPGPQVVSREYDASA